MPERIPWCENGPLFKRLVKEGHSWQMLPYVFFSLSGLAVEMPELTIRRDISEADQWLESYDLLVEGETIEVKSRPFFFTNTMDWPLSKDPAFLDTKKKWDAKDPKPFAYVFVSKTTGCMVATCSTESASSRWQEIRKRDRVRDIVETFYAVPARFLVTMDKLVKVMKGKQRG